MQKTFSFKQIVNTYDSTPDGKISPNAVLNYFQEAAQRHIEELGIGVDYLKKEHFAWILVKYEIEFFSYPKTGEEVTIETTPVGINRFEAYRHFLLKSQSGEVLAEGKSVWMIINTETGRLVRISNVESLRILSEEKEIYKLPNLIPIENFKNEKSFQVRYLDIDINLHVNNVNYLIWAIESLPWEVVRDYEIKTLRIVFKEQAFYGEVVTAKSSEISPGNWRIDIFNKENKLLCQIELNGRAREKRLSTRQEVDL